MKTKNLKKCIAMLCVMMISIFSLIGCGKQSTSNLKVYTDEELNALIPDYSEYITIGTYGPLQYHLSSDYIVTDRDIELGLAQAMPDVRIQKEITDRPCILGDVVNVSYNGTIDGQSFELSTTPEDGISLVLGYANYIDDFENKIVGMSVGDTRTIEITYPTSYNNTDIAGKTAIFVVTMNSIYEYSLPELTDEMVQANSEYDSVDAITAACREKLQADYDRDKETEIYNQLITIIMDATTYSGIPQSEIDVYLEECNAAIDTYASQYSMSRLDVINMAYGLNSEEEFTALCTSDATEYVNIKMLICTIARQNNIIVTYSEFNDYRNSMIESLNITPSELETYYSDEVLLFNCILEKVQTWLMENSTEV